MKPGTVVATSIVLGLLGAAFATSPRAGAETSSNHHEPMAASHGDATATLPIATLVQEPRNDPSGKTGAGGRALAFRPSGRRIPKSVVARAPEALLHHTGVNAIEPTLGVDSSGRVFFIGTEGDQWPAFPSETVMSATDGRTWDIITPSLEGQSRHPYTEDPYLYVDEDTNRVFTSDYLLPCTELSFTDDAGETWTSTVTACDLTDHQTVFAGKPVSSTPTGYPNVVYYCAIDAGVAAFSFATSCIKSLDGGLTFVRTGAPAFTAEPGAGPSEARLANGHCIGATGHGVAGPQGTIYLPRGWCGQPWLAISHDEGLSWERVQIADIGMGDAGGRLDHDAALAVDTRGNLYYSWTAADLLPYLSVSTDDGKTWTEPIMIAPPRVKVATLIALDVATPGNLAVAFIGSERKKKFEDNLYNGYMMMTTDALSADPIFYAAPVNDRTDPIESWCVTGSCRVNREFIDVAIAPDGTVWAPFVDGCFDGRCDHNGLALGIGHGIVGHLVGGPKLN